MITEAKSQQPIKASTLAEYLEMQIHLCNKSQAAIASEVGFPSANVLSMIKRGKTRLPLNRVGPMAEALGLDSSHLFKMVMKEYNPETWGAIERYMLKQPFVSQNELEIIEVIRQSDVTNPKIRTKAEKAALLKVINTFTPLSPTKDD